MIKNTPIKIGGDYSSYLLLMDNKSVFFNPVKNTYNIFPKEEHEKISNMVCKNENKPNDFFYDLKNSFSLFSKLEGIMLIIGEKKETQGTELVDFKDRFYTFIRENKIKHNKGGYSLPIFFLALIGLLWGNLLVFTKKFYFLINQSKKHKKIPKESLGFNVGYNILLASRFLPFTLDCKTLAFAYKFIYTFLGYKCEISIGILEDPFVAHMWASSDGFPHGETSTVIKEFQLIYSSSW